MVSEVLNVLINLFTLHFQESMGLYWGLLRQRLMGRSFVEFQFIFLVQLIIDFFREIREPHNVFLAFVSTFVFFVNGMNPLIKVLFQNDLLLLHFYLWDLVNVWLSELRNGHSGFLVTVIAGPAHFFMFRLAVWRHWSLGVIFLIIKHVRVLNFLHVLTVCIFNVVFIYLGCFSW